MMIPREFDDANRRKKLERTPEQIQIANLKAEIKRLTDAITFSIDDSCHCIDCMRLRAALKEQDNE